jgi:AAA family ATP:ADP antiporter
MNMHRRSPLDRILSLFAPVRAGEGATALVMALAIFTVMTAYYIVKPVREALILSSWGAEAKIYASAGQALLLLGAVPLYSRLAEGMRRRGLLTVVTLFFAGCLVAFFMLAGSGPLVGIAFYLWLGIFNTMIVAQFWSFANDVYTPDEGKRLFAIIGFGMSAGAVSGSVIAGRLIEPLGLFPMMLVSAALLVLSLALMLGVDRRRPETPRAARLQAVARDSDEGGAVDGFRIVLRSRYLLLIALMVVLANLVNTTGEYVLGARVRQGVQDEVGAVVRQADQTDAQWEAARDANRRQVGEGIGRFYADFFSVVNLAGLVLQLFVVARLIGLIGVRRAVMVLPLVAMGGYALMAAVPLMGVARWAKTAENATDYSLQNTVRNMLFLPLSRREKYQGKQAVDTFCMRAGDVLAALVVLAGTTVLHLGPVHFALVNVGLAAAWLLVAAAIGRRFHRLAPASD